MLCKHTRAPLASTPMEDFMFAASLHAHDSHLLHHPLTQAEIAHDTKVRRSAACVASTRNMQLVLIHWLKSYIMEVMAGQPVPDMAAVLLLLATS